MSIMNRLDTARRAHVLKCLAEGMSLRGTARVTGVARMTIEKLVRDLGTACAQYQDKHVRGLVCQRVQCDEIWSFVGAKEKNVTPEAKAAGWGDVWTWTALDADSKLIISFAIGDRSHDTAISFLQDVAGRLTNRIQLTTDGYRIYLAAVDRAFGTEIDYAQLHKFFANAGSGGGRYSPPECVGCEKKEVTGSPDPKHISTSYVERQNLTMRMHMRRFTRLTNGFSKKVEMHAHAVAIHFMWYNFAKIHQTLRITPAMAAGVTDRVWDAEDIVKLIEPAN